MVSKLKFKYKKTIKEAEYVYADLEYHTELIDVAQTEFKQEIARLTSALPLELKNKMQFKMPTPPPEKEEIPSEEAEGPAPITVIANEDGGFDEYEGSPETGLKAPEEPVKQKEVKKLFHKIAESTHPDKLEAAGYSKREISKRIKVFKEAKDAYKEGNWFVLQSLAINLDIELAEPTEEQIEWIRGDINKIGNSIATIKNLTAWHWYHGNEESRRAALQHFFMQIYGFKHPDL
jgi:hypothetical protein